MSHEGLVQSQCVVTFLIAVVKYPLRSSIRKKVFILLPQDGIWSTIVESHGAGVLHEWSRYF